MDGAVEGSDLVHRGSFGRDGFTWTAFAALLAFGFLNAVLGPALPYLRTVEEISYLVAVLHQVAFAVGGGLAGLLASRLTRYATRPVAIRTGLVGAAIAGLGIGYGDLAAVTVPAAFLVSLFGTSALVRLWAALADAHGARRAVALTEGEVAVSLGGITAPLLIAGLAGTALGWRFAFVIGAVAVVAAVIGSATVPIPRPAVPSERGGPDHARRRRARVVPTLVIVFAVVGLEFTLSFWLASYLDDDVGLSRPSAVTMVAGLYAANLAGRLLASRFARHVSTEALLFLALLVALAGTPFLLAATSAAVAGVGLAVTGAGIGATFPLASALHVARTPDAADRAVGQVLATAAIGQILGPFASGALAQLVGLRVGLLVVPALAALAGGGLARHHAHRAAP